MKKISLFLSMIAFVSFVAIAPVSAGNPVTKKATTAQPAKTPAKAPAAKKACCADAQTGKCTMGKDAKTCPEMQKTTAPAPKAK
jgi:D-alanyl-D-alanine carboxypeptidase